MGFALLTDWASRRPNTMQRFLRTAGYILIWGHCQDDGERQGTLVNKVVKGVMDDEVRVHAARRAALDKFIVEEELPDQFRTVFLEWYAGITAHLAEWAFSVEAAPLIGFSGCQGSGKSTLVKAMAHVLREAHGVSIAVLSLDDFYLKHEDQLALKDDSNGNKLLELRGNAGSHDMSFMYDTLAQMKDVNNDDSSPTAMIPRYDKSAYGGKGDRAVKEHPGLVKHPGVKKGAQQKQQRKMESGASGNKHQPAGARLAQHPSGEECSVADV